MNKFQKESQLPPIGEEVLRKIPGITFISKNWEKEIAKMTTEFRGCRAEWFSLCVHLTRNEPELKPNPTLSNSSEIAACIYQMLDAMDFITEQQYVSHSQRQSFADLLYADITYGLDVKETNELANKLYTFRQKDEGMDKFSLCSSVTEQIFFARNPKVALRLSCTLPLFTNLNQCIVALSFGDQQTLKRLGQETERLLRGE